MTYQISNTSSPYDRAERKPEITPSEALTQAIDKVDSAGVRVALKRGADPDSIYLACNWSGDRVLHRAATKGLLEITRMLLDAKASPHIRSSISQMTPLHQACKWGFDEKVVELLLQKGAEPSVISKDYGTPLQCLNARLFALEHIPGANTTTAFNRNKLKAMRTLLEEKISSNVLRIIRP